jgi:hypothetical protein
MRFELNTNGFWPKPKYGPVPRCLWMSYESNGKTRWWMWAAQRDLRLEDHNAWVEGFRVHHMTKKLGCLYTWST